MSHPFPSPRVALLAAVSLGLILSACDTGSRIITPPNTLSILPLECNMATSGTAGFSINGSLTDSSVVTWNAQFGLITKDPNGYSANYIAPTVAGQDTITATISPGPSGQTETLTRICTIGAGESGASTQSALASNIQNPGAYSVVISEVMANSCGGTDYKRYNQYVELYNYGDQSVNVNGWFLYDEGPSGTPDQLVPWVTRSTFNLNPALIVNSTVIPPHGFAIILSPSYADAPAEHRMPYFIQPGVIILTVASGAGLGDDVFHIIGSQNGYDTLTLYIGSLTVIDLVVDTYGTPVRGVKYPSDIEDDFMDTFPHYMSECHAAERIDPRQPDSASNWADVDGGSPGDGPYP